MSVVGAYSALSKQAHERSQFADRKIRAASQIADQCAQATQAELWLGEAPGHSLPPLRHGFGTDEVNPGWL